MRVGILGAAHVHAEGYAAILAGLEGVELIGFSDPDRGRGEAFAKRHGLPWYPSHEALLDEGLDAAVVATENALHLPAVEAAAARGVHLLVEKPIATRLEDARAMERAVEEAGVLFMTAFPMRFSPALVEARELLASGRLGAVRALVGINHSENPKRHRAWFADPELAGGGAVVDHSVHLADLYRWLLGAEIERVYAEVSNPFDPASRVDTAGLLLLELSGGIPASIDASWSRPPNYPRWGHLKLEVVAERGTLVLDAFAGHLHHWRADDGYQWVGYHPDPTAAMVRAFWEAVKKGTPPPVTFADGLAALKVVLAAYRAAREGRPVELSELGEGPVDPA